MTKSLNDIVVLQANMIRAVILLLFFLSSLPIRSQTDTTQVVGPPKAPVIFQEDTLFFIYAHTGAFTTTERAIAITGRLKTISKDAEVIPDSFYIQPNGSSLNIYYGNLIITAVHDEDALYAGLPKAELAESYLSSLKNSFGKEYKLRELLINTLFLLLAIAGLILIFFIIGRIFTWLLARIEQIAIHKLLPDNLLKVLPFINAEKEKKFWLSLIKIARISTILIVLFFYVPLLFNFLPWTKGVADKAYDYILYPVQFLITALLDFLPNLFFIIVILVVVRYTIKLLSILANEVEKENIVFHGFYADWAQPTFSLFRGIILVFSLIIIFPYLPFSDSPAFQGISIFFGVLISLGSTSAVANFVAGVVITYMRPFQIGDRVKIGETMGDVIEKSFLVTRIKTNKNEFITIPSSAILSNHLINFSKNVEGLGLILHTSVTIGYDVPSKEVQQLLINAANDCSNIEKEPKPFVLIKMLNDFYVEYEINAYTNAPKYMAFTYSDLHNKILQHFNEAGVEIMSPHYRSIRDGNKSTVPDG